MELYVAKYRLTAPNPEDLPGEIKSAHLPQISDERLEELRQTLKPVRDTDHNGYPVCELRRWTDMRSEGFFARAASAGPVFGLRQLAVVRTLHEHPSSPSEADVLAYLPADLPDGANAYQWYAPNAGQMRQQERMLSQTGLFMGAAVLYSQIGA